MDKEKDLENYKNKDGNVNKFKTKKNDR